MTPGTVTPGTDLDPAPRALARRSGAVPATPAKRPAPRRWSRSRGVVGGFAVFAVLGFGAAYVGPLGGSLSTAQADEPVPVTLYATALSDAQSRSATSVAAGSVTLDRGDYTVYVTPTPTPEPVVTTSSSESSSGGWTPPFVSPDPGTAQAIAYDMVKGRGWSDDDFSCLVALWNRESGWNVNAYNSGSGAYGIPQALPGNKMASAGGDWETNPATQISWGLNYIADRYGTPCGAWGHSESSGWY